MKKFAVCRGINPDELEKCVNSYLKDGWELYGQSFFGHTRGHEKFEKKFIDNSNGGYYKNVNTGIIIPGKCYFCQTVIKEVEEDDKEDNDDDDE